MALRKLTEFIQVDKITPLIQDRLSASLVAMGVVAVTSEPSLGFGQSFQVGGLSDLTINTYDGTPTTPQDLVSTSISIPINQYPWTNFYMEDVDTYEQAIVRMNQVVERAGLQIAEVIDTDIFATVFASAQTDALLGVTTAPITVTSADALDYVETFVTKLREENIVGDVSICVPEYLGLAIARDVSDTNANPTIAGDTLTTGYIGRIFNVNVYTSNNLPIGVAGGLVAGEYGVVGGKKENFAYIAGLTSFKSGDESTKLASWGQVGQSYGRGYILDTSWYSGVVIK